MASRAIAADRSFAYEHMANSRCRGWCVPSAEKSKMFGPAKRASDSEKEEGRRRHGDGDRGRKVKH